MMEIQKTKVGDVLVLSLNGRLDSQGALIFQAALRDTVDGGALNVVLLGEGVDYISSIGFRVLLAGVQLLRKEGGLLVLAELRQPVKDFLEMAGLLREVSAFQTQEEAVNFAPWPGPKDSKQPFS